MKTQVLEQAISAVVQIYVEGLIIDESYDILNPRNINIGHWSASGCLIRVGSEEGYVLTNAHVVKNGLKYKIRTLLTSEENFEVKLLAFIESQEPDIALLKIEEKELNRMKRIIAEIPYLELEENFDLQRDLSIKAIGYPLGMGEPNITSGKVTNFIYGNEDECERIVTDAAITNGNSGGPAINEEGKIIGLNTSIALEANDIGFITPASFIHIVLHNLTQGKETALTCLGGRFQKNSASNASFLKSPSIDGVIITSILSNSLLAKAGVAPRDILVRINHYQFDSHGIVKNQEGLRHKNIFDIVRLIPLHSKMEIEIIREGRSMVFETQASSLPEQNLKTPGSFLKRSFIIFKGIIFQEINLYIIEVLIELFPEKIRSLIDLLSKDKKKVVATYINFNSPGEELNISQGDIISRVNGVNVFDLKELEAALNKPIEKKEPVVIDFESGSLGVFSESKKVRILTPRDLISELESLGG